MKTTNLLTKWVTNDGTNFGLSQIIQSSLFTSVCWITNYIPKIQVYDDNKNTTKSMSSWRPACIMISWEYKLFWKWSRYIMLVSSSAYLYEKFVSLCKHHKIRYFLLKMVLTLCIKSCIKACVFLFWKYVKRLFKEHPTFSVVSRR